MLDFRTPVFHPGLNLTIRAGDEYLNHPTVTPGRVVSLRCRATGREYGTALIVSVQHFEAVADIPRDFLLFEHVPECRDDRDELERQLVDCYGPDYGPGLTLIFFHFPALRPSDT